MKKLLNTLYILTETAYLSLDGENVVVNLEEGNKQAIPLHTLNNIVSFSYKGASPALMGKCTEKAIQISFYSPNGKYLASISSVSNGNVYLRRNQYRFADDMKKSLDISQNFIIGKLYNSKNVLMRCVRDHSERVDVGKIRMAADNICKYIQNATKAETMDMLRGIEGNSAAEYFGVFNELILQNKADFFFNGRNRRPPMDRVNALLSFAYSLLTNDCAGALYSVGLDPYVGFMHTDRPGRKSLALDLVEELRSSYADRFVLTLINNRIIGVNDFEIQDNGAILLKDSGRRTFLSEWQKKKKECITHPYFKEKICWGLVPFAQALLLARFIRGDMDQYPPFFWK